MIVEPDRRRFDVPSETRRVVLFVVFGACAAAANWLTRFPLERFMSFSEAVVVAYIIGMAIAFALFSRYVFPASSRSIPDQIKFFVLVNLLGFAQVWAISMVLVYRIFPAGGFTGPAARSIAHAIAIGVPAISSYFGHRFLSFASETQRRR